MDEFCNVEETVGAHRWAFNPRAEEEGIHGQES